MAITPKFNIADISAKFDALLDFINDETVKVLQRAGEQAVTHARTIPPPDQGGRGFKDRTANLRSSIGYGVYYDGQMIVGQWPGKAPEGKAQGRALADSAAKGKKGFALIVTAGMYYAVYVESKGRDVLTSAEQKAAQWVKDEMADIRKAILEYWKKL